ncbi:alpha/beta hydrolase [Melissococcus plutonius]|uniref:alpha/beta hydrolase n=1 Tax=Melissococcus plutonius TaxID=33970 RepID=UPI003C301B7A
MQTIELVLTDYQQFTRPAESSLHMLYYDNTPHSCLLILPGGGYEHLAIFKEGIAIQQWAHSNHLHAALFAYQIENLTPEKIIIAVDDCLKMLKSNPLIKKIILIGFSAGGHLAMLFAKNHPKNIAGIILCYPVVYLTGPYAHQGSAQHFFGTTYSEKQANFFSSINGLPISPPPCFIWHTYGDQSVPIENSQALAEALTEKKGMVELHFFPKGKHGLAMTNQDPFIQQWVFLAESWINRLLKRKEEKNND